MKKVVTSLMVGLVMFFANCFSKAEAWVNPDIKTSVNVKMEQLSPEMRTYLDNEVMPTLKKWFKDGKPVEKGWKSIISFRIDKDGNVHDKNYLFLEDTWINSGVEYALMKLNKVSAPPKEYNGELIFVTFEHVYPETKVYFTNVK